jgi:hypothetical protein
MISKYGYIFLFFILCSNVFSIPQKPDLIIDTTTVPTNVVNKQNEKKIFNDPEFNYNEKQKVKSRDFVKELWDWLTRNTFKSKEKEQKKNKKKYPDETKPSDFWNSKLAGKIVSIVSFLVIITIILFLHFTGGLKKIFSSTTAGSSFNFTDVKVDIREINIDMLRDTAVRSGEYRVAIRWSYLKILKIMTIKRQIEWMPFKTNHDYYLELQDKFYLEEFKAVSRIYDYVWYGKNNLTEKQYLDLIEKFNHLEGQVNV